MQVCVIGSGYVGLVSGTCFAEFGLHVMCVDKDAAKIEALHRNHVPIYEPGLDELIVKNVQAGRLAFSTDIETHIAKADVVLIAVGTPSRPLDGHADLTFVFEAAETIAKSATGYTVVVIKSTVPVGTGRRVLDYIQKISPHLAIDVVSNPEFLREGAAIDDFMQPDRVVIGAQTERSRGVMRHLYRPLDLIETPIVFTTLESSELIKYAANGFLATKIAFINEMADLCEQCGADVQEVAKGMGLDRRIGNKFLHAGPGYGGSCFPKDTLALIQTGVTHGVKLSIVEAVSSGNDKRKEAMVTKIINACGGTLKGKTIGVLGVTFKPNTDDMRDSPSLTIIPGLQKEGALIQAYDPVGMEEAAKMLTQVQWKTNAYDAMKGADALVIITEWNEFRALDWAHAKTLLKAPLVIDLRNIYPHNEMEEAKLHYVSIGRKTLYVETSKGAL